MSADDPATLAARRRQVLDALGDRAAMILPAAPEIVVGRDVELRYVADADLRYLTGYTEPEAVAVLCPGADHPFTLFVRDRDARQELWTGPRADVDETAERYGADDARPVDDLETSLPDLLGHVDRIYFRLGTGRHDVETLVLHILGAGRAARQRSGHGPAELVDPGLLLDDMRLVKDAGEIDAIREAVGITVDAFRDALPLARSGAGEWQVEAAIEAGFRRAGAEAPAFATIAASGPNATVLHYTANGRTMQSGDLLLLDAGARHRGYNADLTRTVPVDGRFQGISRHVYDAVHQAGLAAIQAVRPGTTIQAVHHAALEVLVPAMVDLGLLHGDPRSLLDEESAWKRWFPHNTSHWLGLDVHDVGTYTRDDQPRPLRPGMVLTIEPGLYIPALADEAPETLRGIGIRIEEDVLVTAEGREVLSAALPTDPDELRSIIDNRR